MKCIPIVRRDAVSFTLTAENETERSILGLAAGCEFKYGGSLSNVEGVKNISIIAVGPQKPVDPQKDK